MSRWCYVRTGGRAFCRVGDADVRLDPAVSFQQIVFVEDLCGLTDDGRVLCWAAPADRSSAGLITLMESAAVVEIPEGATDLHAMHHYMCALADGDVWCWDMHGLRATQTGCCEATPVRMTSVGDVIETESSLVHVVCALRANGVALCFGGPPPLDIMGAPPPDEWVTATPRAVVVSAPLRWIESVGDASFCGADAQSRLHCWGWGRSALLGMGADGRLSPDAAFWESVEVDLSATAIAGDRNIGCVFEPGGPRCVTTDPAMAQCPQGLTAALRATD